LQAQNKLLLFGGTVVRDGAACNELFWIGLDRMEWHQQPTRGLKPPPRYGHCSVYDPEHNQLVVFGGR
jgi:hypothetical protein